MNINQAVSKYNYISFDIFDTLIRRLVYHPHQVFSLMEKYARVNSISIPKNFKQIRIRAEQKANKENYYADIYDIYDRILEFESDFERNEVLNLEIQAELELCVPNSEIVSVFNNCIETGKYVVITSDMYLTKQILIKILDKCGISEYKKLYVSCDYKADKRNGELFRILLDDLRIQAKEIIHIGDNKKSDFLRPMTMGIHSLIYRSHFNDIYTNKTNQEIAYLNQQTFLGNMLSIKPKDQREQIPFRVGYVCLGPLLLGFSKWLEKCFKEDKIDKVFFLSRDGKIMERAYETIRGNAKHQYFYASRRALIVPTIWKHPELQDATQLFFTSDGDTVRSILVKLGLESGKYEMKLKKHGLNLGDHVDFQHIKESKFAKFYEEIKSEVIANSKNQYDLLKQYMKESGFHGNIAIVDVGWFGNMQRALTDVAESCGLDVDIYGYYVGVDPDSKTVEENHLNVRGFLFEKGRRELRRYEKSINAIVEFIFSTSHGSVLGYEIKKSDKGTVSPILDRYEYTKTESDIVNTNAKSDDVLVAGASMIEDEEKVLNEIQNQAIEYISDIEKNDLFKNQLFNPKCSFCNLLEIGTHPIKEDRDFIGNLRIIGADLKFRYLARPKSLLFYAMHYKYFKSDLKYSGWRVGFVSRLLKIHLPYAEIYFKMRDWKHKMD